MKKKEGEGGRGKGAAKEEKNEGRLKNRQHVRTKDLSIFFNGKVSLFSAWEGGISEKNRNKYAWRTTGKVRRELWGRRLPGRSVNNISVTNLFSSSMTAADPCLKKSRA